MNRPFIKWRYCREALCILILAATSWYVGMATLKNWQGPAGSLTNDLFIPAIMMNAGLGFSNIHPENVPNLRSFLDFQTPDFDIQNIPETPERTPLHPYQEFHRYLVYTVALCWKLWGINWDSMKILLGFYLLLTCMGVYAICRLAMNPFLALFVVFAFLLSPAVTSTLPILRDFAKAPFILGVAYCLACIVFRKNKRTHFFIYVLLAGLLLGLGMGFRRDVMIFVPISIFFLFFGSIKRARYAIGAKITATILLVAIFLLAGWPIHKSLLQSGYLAAHDTIMGFSSFSDHELGLIQPASCEKHYLLNDMYSTIKAHYAAGMGATFPKSEYQERAAEPAFDVEVKRAYVNKIIMTFPADMLSRAYAAVMNTISGLTQTPIKVEKYGLWFTGIALLLIAANSPLRAWLLLAMLCCFCGYTSIQYAVRHAFHTSFVPFFFLGLLLQQVTTYTLRQHPIGKQHTEASKQKQTKPNALRLCFHAALWFLLTATLFYLPLAIAKHIQHGKVETIRTTYKSAPLEQVDYTRLRWDNRPLIAPTATIKSEGFTGKCLLADFTTGILVASFDNLLDKDLKEFRAIYEWKDGIGDFGGPLNVHVRSKNNATGPVSLYFPVHEKIHDAANWSRFIGLSMSETAQASFKGLSIVKDISTLSLLFNMLIPEEEDRFIYNQPLSIPWKGRSWTKYHAGSFLTGYSSAWQIQNAIDGNNLHRAKELAQNATKNYQGSIIFTLLLAECLEFEGNTPEVHRIIGTLLATFPEVSTAYEQVDRYLDRHGGVTRKISGWSAIITDFPKLTAAKTYLDNAQAASNIIYNPDNSNDNNT